MQQVHKMRFLILLVFLGTIIVTEISRASDGLSSDAQSGERFSERYSAQACRADFQKYCSYVPRNRVSIAQCIQRHEANLSDSCQQALRVVRARFRQFVQSCRTDVQEVCATVPSGKGRIIKCLRVNRENLSEPCAKTLDTLSSL